MTPEEFKDKWRNTPLTEKQSYQTHFNDLCRLLDVPAPYDGAAEASSYCFEKGAEKTTGKPGWADVWKRGCFGWEYKKSHGDLTKAYAQLQQYAPALENPPLLIVCDTQRFVIHTNFTNTPRVTHEFGLADLVAPETRKLLRLAFTDPDQLKPGVTRESITKDAARHFAALADRLRARGLDPQRVAHFVSRLLFCLFAEDIELFPAKLFSKLLAEARKRPDEFEPMARALFAAMKTGGRLGFDAVPFFNGGLFDDDDALPLDRDDLKLLEKASDLDWAAIDPSIFGTLFERGLDPGKRAQLGKFYTDAETILKIVEPVVLRPLRREWAETKARIADLQAKAETAKAPAAKTRLRNETKAVFNAFHERLIGVRVLDPACGSGNFLYLALKGLKDLEHRILLDAVEMGVERAFPRVGPESVRGLEINPYAAELARVSIWIGEIQWMMDHGYGISRSPILRALDQIECRDALMNEDGSEAEWPAAEFIVGNPPFLGDKKMLRKLGDTYVRTLREIFKSRLSGGVNFVCYWFDKAHLAVRENGTKRAGLVATSAIRSGANRRVLERILESSSIVEAWGDEAWVNDGAAVRVSLVAFAGSADREEKRLNGHIIEDIRADLSGSLTTARDAADVTKAARLTTNLRIAFVGDQKSGSFEVDAKLARTWLQLPRNPHGKANSDVLRPWANGSDLLRRGEAQWIIDFGTTMTEGDASFFQAPFEHVASLVRPARINLRRENHRRYWWRHGEARPGMRLAINALRRYCVTPRVSKHRIFEWLHSSVLPDSRLCVFAREDDCSFGVLHSRFHQTWSLATCSWHGVGNDPTYNTGSCFETFPFPEGLTPDLPAAGYAADPRAQRIAAAAAELVRLRDAWLNPPEWVTRVPEVVPGYPDRLLPVPEHAAELKKRTLTNLYNQRPTWLANAHRDLDAAVDAAYGWPADLSDDEVLARLFRLNQERAGAGR